MREIYQLFPGLVAAVSTEYHTPVGVLVLSLICNARIVGRLTSTLEESVARGAKHLGPIIQDRLRLQDEYGDDWSAKPVRTVPQSYSRYILQRCGVTLFSRLLNLDFTSPLWICGLIPCVL